MTMTKEDAASQLNGREYRDEGTSEFFASLKVAGLVAVFGASDDLMEFRGAINDEIGVYDDGTVYLTRDGLLENKCANDKCPHFAKLKKTAEIIKAIWDDGGVSWRYGTTIPHATFTVNEDGEPYCIGIVFALADVEAAA